MFEVFGEFDSVEELNACADGLRQEEDIIHLRKLAAENGIPEGVLRAYEIAEEAELADPILVAMGKLDVEAADMGKTGLPVREITSYLSMQCYEDEKLARQIRRKGKSLKACMEKIRKEAEQRVKERRGTQIVAMSDMEVFQMAETYYKEA